MKGCLIAFACFVIFLIILGVGCGGYMAFKGRAHFAKINLAMADLRETNQSWPFEVPGDGLLEADRLADFFAIRDEAQEPIAQLVGRTDRLNQGGEEMGPIAAIREAFGLVTDIFGAFLDVPVKLTQSLHQQSMSADEYIWVCDTIHLTLVKAAEDGHPAATEIVRSLEDQHEKLQIDVQDEKVSYQTMQRSLERREAVWLPANLDLILRNVAPITDSSAAILLDACVLEIIRERVEEDTQTSER
ncbi:MAG: hypothetical protein V2A76_01885 [Planctomycetota bacterium]